MTNASRSFSISRLTVWVWRYLVPLLLLGLAVHLMLPQLTTFNHALKIIREMIPLAVILAVAAQVTSYLGSGYLLQAIVTIVGQRLSVVYGTVITTAASSIGLVAGGLVGSVAATYRWLRDSGVSAEGAILAGWLPTLFNNGALIVVTVVGLPYLLIVHKLSTLQAVSFGLILLILSLFIIGILWGLRHRPQLTAFAIRVSSRWARLRNRPYDPAATKAAIGHWFSALDVLRTGGWHGPAVGAALNVFFDMLTLYLLFIAANHAVSPGILLVGYGFPQLLGKVTFLPGGVGVVEGTMAVMYDSLGVPDPISLVVILTYRVISFWLPTLLGFLLIPYLHRLSSNTTH